VCQQRCFESIRVTLTVAEKVRRVVVVEGDGEGGQGISPTRERWDWRRGCTRWWDGQRCSAKLEMGRSEEREAREGCRRAKSSFTPKSKQLVSLKRRSVAMQSMYSDVRDETKTAGKEAEAEQATCSPRFEQTSQENRSGCSCDCYKGQERGRKLCT
jgi:hypothetical protein